MRMIYNNHMSKCKLIAFIENYIDYLSTKEDLHDHRCGIVFKGEQRKSLY